MLTGETGAGKSLIIDALGLALGARADTSLVRHGAEVARVEALFDRVPELLIASREVSASGRSTARLDDESVTAARLAETTGPLVEIHGQHDQGRLLDPRWQRDLLDAFGGHEPARAAMAASVARWRENRSALAALVTDPRELARRLEPWSTRPPRSMPPDFGPARRTRSGHGSQPLVMARRSRAAGRRSARRSTAMAARPVRSSGRRCVRRAPWPASICGSS